VDGERFHHGHIYVAPPDRHMLLNAHAIRVTRGPRENGFRPAVDPLFRSAAEGHGSRVNGIVLSGGLNDGTHGLPFDQEARRARHRAGRRGGAR
jgi:two-component system chemotaxis response regulator CheB